MTDKPDSLREGTDEALMVQYQRGDRNALAVVVRRHARLLYATAFGITGASPIADELTRNTFLAIVTHAGSFHIEMHFRSWLFGFLHQLVMDHGGRLLADSKTALSIEGRTTTEDFDTEAPLPLAKSARSQLLSRRIAECTAQLPLLEREVLVMKLTAQLTLVELAVATATDVETIRTRLRHALDKMRESVSDTEDYARALR
jgi:RNA polymerase sigma-70 factor, ECF subfamily